MESKGPSPPNATPVAALITKNAKNIRNRVCPDFQGANMPWCAANPFDMPWSSSTSSRLGLKATCVGFLKGDVLLAWCLHSKEWSPLTLVQDTMIWAQGSACRLVINSVHWTLIFLLQRCYRSYLLLPSLIEAKSSQQPNSNQKSSKKPVKGWASICMQTAKGFWRLKLTLKEHLPINWPSFKTADPRSLATSCLSALCYSNRLFNNLSNLIIWKNTWVSIRVTGHLRLNRQSHCLNVPNGPLMSHQDLESIFDSRTLLKAFTPRNYWHSQQTSAKFS